MLRWTDSEKVLIGGFRLCLVTLALGCPAAGLLAGDPAPQPSALDRLKERNADLRWEESRSQWRNDSSKVAAPAATPPRADSPRFEAAAPRQNVAPAGHPEMVENAPLVDENGVGFLKPIMIASQLQPVPDAPNPAVDDSAQTIFRPITEIRPYYNYSVLAKSTNEYLCPEPKGLPEGMQVNCPDVIPLAANGSTDRFFGEVNYQWAASNLVHKPLYFEDVALERYGQQFCDPVQPFVSLGKFGVDVLALPYTMALDPICNDQYALGYYRPGDCAPELLYQPPLNAKAAATATGVYTGLFFLFP